MNNRMEFESKTRSVFDALHKSQAADSDIYNRLTSLLTADYLRVDDDFFYNKVCLDAGCGSNANATLSMLKMGAGKVVAFDLDESIFETAPSLLKEFGDRCELGIGNVLSLDYDDCFFDFVHCGGVLHHTANPLQGLKELARVTKAGGMLYIHIYGTGGLIRDITSLFREKYNNEKLFQAIVDGLSADILRKWVTSTLNKMDEKGDPLAANVSKLDLNTLIDDDLVLTIKDRIQAPVYIEHSEEQLRECLIEEGFYKIERLSRYPKFNNIRRFLSPLYDDYNSELAKLLYGAGYIQLKAVKR